MSFRSAHPPSNLLFMKHFTSLAFAVLFSGVFFGQTIFNVDMSCANEPGATQEGSTEVSDVFVTGPWCGWCSNEGYNALADDDGDGIFTVAIDSLNGTVEYKYAVNGFADQEQLVDDMVDGADCGPVTDFAVYANRQIEAGTSSMDVFGACALCIPDTSNGGGDGGGGVDSTLVGLVNLTFDEQASVTAWEPIADATIAEESTLNWNPEGQGTGALEIGGFNQFDGIGRAYIFQYFDPNLDYQGSTDLTLSFDIKAGSPLIGAAIQLQSEFPGTGVLEVFDLQNQGLNESTWTNLSYDISGVYGDGIFRMSFNVAAGSFVDAGGLILVDNITLTGSGAGETGSGTTFNVDMGCATAFGGMTNGTTAISDVFVTGPWCNWCSNEGFNQLLDPDGDGVFSRNIGGLEGEVEYKYAVNGFADQEQLLDDAENGGACVGATDLSTFANRTMLAGEQTDDVFGRCGDCGVDTGGAEITFRVDVSQYTGNFNSVNLNGSFNGWCGDCNPMTNAGGGVFEVTLSLALDTIEYKFTFDGWSVEEWFNGTEDCTTTIDGFVNRSWILTENVVLPVACFESCDACEETQDVLGCTDPAFLEFDPYATIDNGTCSLLAVPGCVYSSASNFNPIANIDDYSCVFDASGDEDCLGDLDGDGAVTISDLLAVLAILGMQCP